MNAQIRELRNQRKAILELTRQYGASNVRVFGSVARKEGGAASDILTNDSEPQLSPQAWCGSDWTTTQFYQWIDNNEYYVPKGTYVRVVDYNGMLPDIILHQGYISDNGVFRILGSCVMAPLCPGCLFHDFYTDIGPKAAMIEGWANFF
jgi:hypothetical protein